jgi:DNA-directed RNA polymerase specialized sigma24 family protein
MASAPRHFVVIRCILKQAELAEEALQRAFLKVWQGIASCKWGFIGPTAWLFAIVGNQAIDITKRLAERLSQTAVELNEANSMFVMPEAELALEQKLLKKISPISPANAWIWRC